MVIITGLSGSGKSTAARALEDSGFFLVDNLPFIMLPDFLNHTDQGYDKVAVVVDARSSEFLTNCSDILQNVMNMGYRVDVVFFEASDQDLVRRFSETRRRHPLVKKEGIVAAIKHERQLMENLRQLATVVLDSSGTTVHQLRKRVLSILFGNDRGSDTLKLQLISFGYRHGLPLEADLVFDVRFLDNPHFHDLLRPQTGLDPAVSTFVMNQPDSQVFLDKLRNMLSFLIPRYQEEGKAMLTIALGCTGGRHRSVALVEALCPYLLGYGLAVDVVHRDLNKE
ncbi:MAG: RNase adapter RapZ [Deltaproteobacteria bacterium]|nr:RNase adapter RapZ [Deltaproteobacteria bacterium]